MDFQKIMNSGGIYSIQEHLMAMRAGYKNNRLTDSLKENVSELKWGRNGAAQNLIYELLTEISDSDTIENTEKIDELLSITNADKVVNKTPHTFGEYFEKEEDEDIFS